MGLVRIEFKILCRLGELIIGAVTLLAGLLRHMAISAHGPALAVDPGEGLVGRNGRHRKAQAKGQGGEDS